MQSKIIFRIPFMGFLLFILMVLFSCGGSSGAGDSTILFNARLMESDDFFTGAHWNDPHVLHDGSQFVMYASSDEPGDEEGYVKIFMFTSPDGKNWTISNSGNPVFEAGSLGQWDEHCVETPAVVYYNSEYHLFYTGYDVPYNYTADDGNGAGDGDTDWDNDVAAKHFHIGHATSLDGISWTRDGDNPIVSPTDPYAAPNLDFNQSVVGEPAPVVFDNKIYLYFTAVGAASEVGTTWQTIGLTVFNGTAWDSPRRVLTPDLTLYPRTSGEEYAGYSTPNALVIDGSIHLFYDVVINDPWTQVKIHHAVSTDGETGWVQDSAPLLQRSDYFWTESEIRSPSAIVYQDNLYLYFAGHYFDGPVFNLGIGLRIYNGVPF